MLNIISIVLGYVRTGVEPLDLLQLADDDAPRVRFREDSGMEGSSNFACDSPLASRPVSDAWKFRASDFS